MPTAIMDLMNTIFKEYLDKFVIVFIDDVLIYSWSSEDQMEHLQTVSKILKEKKLYIKFKKSEFWLNKIAFHGHIVSSERISVDPSKVEAVIN